MSIRSCRPLPKERAETAWGKHVRLPQDLLEKSVKRLGMVGLLSAAVHLLLHYGTRLIIPDEVLRVNPILPAYFPAMWVAIGAGLSIYALTRTGKLSTTLMLDIGLIFEVVGALCIGLIDASRNSIRNPVDAGPAGIAVWITLFVLVIPNTLGKTALAAFASATMSPIALIVAAYTNNQPPPAPFQFLVVALPNLLLAACAIILSRFVYSLGADVSKAREMGSYKLVELLGRGGMGEVWRAQHRLLARPAAIKLIQREVLCGADSSEAEVIERRFAREALSHGDAIVAAYNPSL